MTIRVDCSPIGADHRCQVKVGDGRSVTRHSVLVKAAELARWGKGRSAEDLVRRSFEFLLERESKESILGEFELSVIQRYFPDYDEVIGRRA